jgi:disulfide bond formation protein DsbB
MQKLQQLMQSKRFWIALMVLGMALEGVAVFYQYVLEEPPCILCIHFRLLVVLLIVFSLIGLLLRSVTKGRILVSIALLAVFAGMLERSYQLLGTERGFIRGECAATLNFPDWIAIDKWMPAFFQPWTSCSYTPKLFFNITMAEGLMVFSLVMVLLAISMLIANLRYDVRNVHEIPH